MPNVPTSKKQQQLSPQQRAVLFAQATRKYIQNLPSQSFSDNQTISFQLPKARFLSKVYLQVSGTFKATHASKTSWTPSVFEKYNLIKQVRMSINNGFNPYQISGARLRLYNIINNYKNVGLATDTFGQNRLDNVVSSSGATNTVKFTLELPITINERDTVGLILLQNESTLVTIDIDCNALSSIMADSDITLSAENIMITPIVETFSVPAIPEAVPDYSVLKIVNEQVENVVSAGEMTIKIPTSLTYRKFFVYLASDTSGTPIDPSLIKNFQLVFNQADSPININADFVAYKNKQDYQGALPLGCYCFDFSSQGIANLGGGRDYIDSERLTEMWLKIQFGNITGNSNYVYFVSEKLARLV